MGGLQFGGLERVVKVKRSRQLLEGFDSARRDLSKSQLIQHVRKLGVPLTENVCEKDRVLDGGVPRSGCECEFGFPVSPFWNRGQLEKITSDDKLNATKWTTVIPDPSCNFLQFVEEVPVYHRHLVNNQDLSAHPAIPGLLVLLDLEIVSVTGGARLMLVADLLHKLWNRLFTQPNTRETVQSHTLNVAGGKASGCRYRNPVRLFLVLVT